jgi:hypothetical protein
MRKVLKVMLLGLMTTAMLATSVMAAEWVYVTKNGKKYHPETSRFAKMEGIERISKEEAEARGLEPSKAYLELAEQSQQLQQEKKAPKAK